MAPFTYFEKSQSKSAHSFYFLAAVIRYIIRKGKISVKYIEFKNLALFRMGNTCIPVADSF